MLVKANPYVLPSPDNRRGNAGRSLEGEATRRLSPPPPDGALALEDDEFTALATEFRVALHGTRATWQAYVDARPPSGRTFVLAAQAERGGNVKGSPLVALLAGDHARYAATFAAAGRAERAEAALDAWAARPETVEKLKQTTAAAVTDRVVCYVLAAQNHDGDALEAGDMAGKRYRDLLTLRQWLASGLDTTRSTATPPDVAYARSVAVLALSVDRETLRAAMRFPEVDLGRYPHLAPLVPIAKELGITPPASAPKVAPVKVTDRRGQRDKVMVG